MNKMNQKEHDIAHSLACPVCRGQGEVHECGPADRGSHGGCRDPECGACGATGYVQCSRDLNESDPELRYDGDCEACNEDARDAEGVVSPHWSAALVDLGACEESIEWSATQPDSATAWAACERPDWLLWLAGRTATTAEHRQAIVLAACDCARTSLMYVPAGEDRPRLAVEAAEAWCRGEATVEEVRHAYAAANAAYANAAAYAAYAAYAAVYAANAAVYAAVYAANAAARAAANAAADAADAAARAAANAAARAAGRVTGHAEMARLIRARIACPVLEVES